MRKRKIIKIVFKSFLIAMLCCMAALLTVQIPRSTSRLLMKPLPHQISRYEGGLPLRLAMVHDTLVERYERHGPAWYVERNRRVQEELGRLGRIPDARGPSADRWFELQDDLAAGLERLHQSTGAVRLMRAKLADQERLGYQGRELYTTYANLGTFLIHAHFGGALAGDRNALEGVREGRDYIRRSIEVNPEAHFGREEWQANVVEWFLRMLDDPEMLCRTSCIHMPFDELPSRRSTLASDRFDYHYRLPEQVGLFHPSARGYLRQMIATVNIPPWFIQPEIDTRSVSIREPLTVPFDEPVLGMLGMWWLGGGPNPHFAAALGLIMESVGQDAIAWTSYARALTMAERVSADPELTARWTRIIRDRQQHVGERLGKPEELQERFDRELQAGLSYQTAYQEYESTRIAAGGNIDDPDFFADFYRDHATIATRPGKEDFVLVRHDDDPFHTRYQLPLWTGIVPVCVFALGLFIHLVGSGINKLRRSACIEK